ncbi:hypothetical protein AKJ09_09364 [Labilithrix luteola]|uniref:ASPIC/UnbV domain-containing protein n=1 Tax=Labilithrix luteola TaxID=1391654 RepID=A0A0K1QA83_9BACT|nr:hypothetical protein AKJ09_09364 [Labilithrix luteola]
MRDHQLWGGVFDETAYHIPTFVPIGPNEYEWSGKDTEEGILGVQISNGNSNRWVKIGVKGTKDLTTAGRVNRDGIGAIVRFTPDGGKQVLSPVLGGSSHASQHSLVQGFGLKTKTKGRAEVLWPGGVKNRLYDVMAGESVTIPRSRATSLAAGRGTSPSTRSA